uniref:Uncharacterized protein n=1 Tax=viral metagenome TaxID=1070528 RepID=A0A6M3K566_9ZZZZ
MADRKIKFICNVVKWFDKVNGNTYHSVRVTRLRDGKTITTKTPYQYGYGEQYRQTALALMAQEKWLPVKYRGEREHRAYERENNYPIMWEVRDGLKRDMIANGTL